MTTKPSVNATELLVDDHHGIYSVEHLAQRWTLFVETKPGIYSPIPEDEAACLRTGEALDYDYDALQLFSDLEHSGLYVDIDGTFYRVESDEGGIFAIHPDAEWSDDDGWYILPTFEA